MKTFEHNKRKFWIGMVISAACIIAIPLLIEPAQILDAVRTAQVNQLVFGGLFIVLYMILRAVRWRYLLHNKISGAQIFHMQNIGYMLTQLLPFRVGDVARAVLVGNTDEVTVPQGFSTMVVERILDMLLMVLLLPLALTQVTAVPFWLIKTAQLSGVAATTALLMLIFLAGKRPFAHQLATRILNHIPFLDTPTWTKRLDDLLAGLAVLTRWRSGLTLFGLSVIAWLPIVFAYIFIMQAVHLQPTLTMAIFVMVMGAFSVAAPSSPGQIGVFHAGVTAAMALLGQPAAQSVTLAVLYHAINFLVMVLLGVVGLFFVNAGNGRLRFSVRSFIQKPSQRLSTN